MSGRIQIENLSKVFGGNDEEKVVALDGITAEIPEVLFRSSDLPVAEKQLCSAALQVLKFPHLELLP